MVSTELFTKYRKSTDEAKVLFLYLILNNYDLSKVEKVVEVVQEKAFGIEYRKIFGVTKEFIDIQKIEAELKEVRIPVICSPQSYEIYSTAETIYAYRAENPNSPLYINDMGVISPLMIITENCIVSNNVAERVENTRQKGFMYFADYVLKGVCKVGAWEISYNENKEFRITYTSETNGIKSTETLYHALELDQTSTFKLVLYIIGKVANTLNEFSADNYIGETWRLENTV